MTGQGASKGNGAAKRMSNTKLKEKRARSWAKGQQRKKVRNAENEARAKANSAALAELGGTRQSYERVTERRVTNPKTGLVEIKTFKRVKQESPGTALARTKRQQGVK